MSESHEARQLEIFGTVIFETQRCRSQVVRCLMKLLQGIIYDSDGDFGTNIIKFYHQMELILNGSTQTLTAGAKRKLV